MSCVLGAGFGPGVDCQRGPTVGGNRRTGPQSLGKNRSRVARRRPDTGAGSCIGTTGSRDQRRTALECLVAYTGRSSTGDGWRLFREIEAGAPGGNEPGSGSPPNGSTGGQRESHSHHPSNSAIGGSEEASRNDPFAEEFRAGR